MSAVAEMAKDRTADSAPSEGAAEQKKNVKVTPGFHRRLKMIAAALGVEMGQLVEREMEEFLNREEQAIRKG